MPTSQITNYSQMFYLFLLPFPQLKLLFLKLSLKGLLKMFPQNIVLSADLT